MFDYRRVGLIAIRFILLRHRFAENGLPREKMV